MKKFSLITLALLSVFLALPASAQQAYINFQIPGWLPGSAATYNICAPTDSYTTCFNAGGGGDVAITTDFAGAVPITQPALPNSLGQVQVFTASAGVYQILVETTAPIGFARNILYYVGAQGSGVAGTSSASADGYFEVLPGACVSATTGTAGATNNTLIVDGSTPALTSNSTAAAASVHTFTCTINLPTRLTAGKGATLQDVTYFYSVQTTTATSMTASTLASFTGPTAAPAETASPATLVPFGGVLVQTPVVASANLTAVSAGQYYTEKVALGTPSSLANLQSLVFTFAISQSAAAAQIVTTPGIVLHYNVPAGS